MKQKLVLALLAFAAASVMAQPADTTTFFGEWAVSTNNPMPGMSFKARLVVSEVDGTDGSRAAMTYLEFQNTNNAINVLYIYYSGSLPELICELSDSHGKAVPSRFTGAYNGPLPQPCWLALPSDSIVRCRPGFFRVGTASNGELLVDAGLNQWRHWVIPHGDTNDYYLSGTLKLTVPSGISPPSSEDKNQPPTVCQGTLNLPPVKIPAGGAQANNSINRFSRALTYRDPDSGIIFYVESDGHQIAALDMNGKLLWHRQPATDGNLPPYSQTRPQPNPLVSWIGALTEKENERLKNTGSGKFIGIRFNSRQGGALDVRNGNFIFQGQD